MYNFEGIDFRIIFFKINYRYKLITKIYFSFLGEKIFNLIRIDENKYL